MIQVDNFAFIKGSAMRENPGVLTLEDFKQIKRNLTKNFEQINKKLPKNAWTGPGIKIRSPASEECHCLYCFD